MTVLWQYEKRALEASGVANRPPLERYAKGQLELRQRLAVAVRQALRPPPVLSLSAWADRYAYLSPETSSESGKFRAFAYQIGMMDAVTNPEVERITVMKSARIGYTKVLDHICGYFVHQDPSPVLIVQPRVEDAQDYSRSEIMPMLRDTPALKSLVGEVKAHDPNQRILKRMFPNGASLSFVGANSPGGFRRITARVILFDEIDGYSIEGAGKEGDQIALATTRSQTFWNRKIVLGSTPTIRGMSLIERSFEQSDKRFYYVPCPQCGHMQTLRWANLRWDRSPEGVHLPDTAHFVCVENGCIIEERAKRQMIGAGEWRPTAPFMGHAGFHIWAAYSLWPNASWRNLLREFLAVKKDPVALRTFVNTVWGETWEDTVERVEGHSLLARCEAYGLDSLPIEVKFLTAGVDTQGDRLELQVIGWGAAEESWVVDYEVLLGDPAQPSIWQELDGLLLRPYHNETGREMRIQATCIDMLGHHGNQVLQFCDARRSRLVLPIGGTPGPRPIWPKRASATKTHSRVYMIGSDTGKDVIYGRLKITKKGPGYVHFPAHDAINQRYFEQLTSEHVITKYRFGRPYRKWELPSGKRNEALDTFCYALAARMSRPIRLTDAGPPPQVPRLVAEIREVEQAGTHEDVHSLVDEINQPPQQQYARPSVKHSSFEQGGWMGGRRDRGWFDRD